MDHYLFSRRGVHRSRRAAEHEHTKRLADDPRVSNISEGNCSFQ